MNTRTTNSGWLKPSVFTATAVLLAISLMVITPQGRALAQAFLNFFTRAESDSLPVQSFQTTLMPATPALDPGDINNATLTVSQAAEQSGYRVFEPASLPAAMAFVGATVDPENHSIRLFYRDEEMNSLVLREEPFQQMDDCELCGKVGASAAVEMFQIGDAPGEYVEGVWKLTDQGPEWVSDPYLKTLRWQRNGTAFELLYMGIPETLTKADMVAIAKSIQ